MFSQSPKLLQPHDDLPQAARSHWRSILLIGLFSVFVNLLMLTGPLFMLQVYDRVLASRSEATLVALFVLVVGLYGAMGVLDFVRGRIGARIGAKLQTDLDARVFTAALKAPPGAIKQAITGLSDLEAVRRFCTSSVAFAAFDLLFTPLFLGAIFMFHPLLGWLSVGGGVTMVAITLTNQLASRKRGDEANQTAAGSARLAEQIRTQPDTIRSLGMTKAAIAKWDVQRGTALRSEMALSDRNGGFGSLTKSLRFLLQSAMLGLGAWLVIQGELTAGAMIAGSILLGRTLAPVEQLIGGWAVVGRAHSGWKFLRELLEAVPQENPKTALSRPKAHINVEQVTVIPPGEKLPALRQVTFDIEAGQALGVVGESASGKSSVARVLTGLWLPVAGSVRLDGATLDQYEETALASYVGYLPQEIALFDGTVADNIARMQPDADPKAIIRAAKKAGAHEMILGLPAGYDTPIRAVQTKLSGGQKQRIGLARAMFGDPEVLILDEPNANLDAKGSDTVNTAIRQMKADKKIVIVMAHRPSAIKECDTILMLKEGRVADFGPRDEVLRKNVRNHAQIAPAPAPKVVQ
ncbi:type I secretion system permease/ATPase [Pseudohalocynthiibacter sp. F2068]|uniref:type I secretion system permease/ATPase n=1 Tax=Pseudohalocynthiibacter sp. F2068 TaxID=2926418 RepID=UPI00248C32F5|nr:type I secretion system permease/ATPase [Pseudohalocynthiibacter sp. F2068]